MPSPVNGAVPSPQPLQQFDKLTYLASLYSPVDDYQHVIVATREGGLFDVFFNQSHTPQSRTLFNQLLVASVNIGMAGFYSPNDKVCHAVVLSREGKLHDVTFSQQQSPVSNEFPIQFDLKNVASLAGFFSPGDDRCHVTIAFTDGRIFDVHYPSQQQKFASVSFLGDSGEKILIVAAFFSPDRNSHHVVVRTKDGGIYDYSHSIQGKSEKILSTPSPLSDIVDVGGYHSASDGNHHIVIATRSGNLYDFYYPL
jgi:hypothetical protein